MMKKSTASFALLKKNSTFAVEITLDSSNG